MNTRTNDEVYVDWMTKWRMWKNAWVDCEEQIVDFFIKFISKNKQYSPIDHAEFASHLNDYIATCKVDKSGNIEIHNQSTVLPQIELLSPSSSDQDRFGIVSLKLGFFTRRDILKVTLILESLGHGVIHDDGRIVSRDYSNDSMSPRRMPCRDDPVWNIVSDTFNKTNR